MKSFPFLILFFSIASSFLLSCSKDIDHTSCNGEISVNFINATGENLSDMYINEIRIGNILQNSESGEICFEKFGIDTGMPDVKVEGNYLNKTLGGTNQFYWCGTQKENLPPGSYTIKIEVVPITQIPYFHLSFVK
jgi:hypothetical protein